jgi:hypothetical protein
MAALLKTLPASGRQGYPENRAEEEAGQAEGTAVRDELTEDAQQHDKNLAAAYGWSQLFRGMVGTVIIPLVLVVWVSPRWAAYSLIPCGIALFILVVVAIRRKEPLLRPEYRALQRLGYRGWTTKK